MTPIVTRLKALRAKAEIPSQAELSRRSGVPQSTVSRLESGASQGIDFGVLEKLADALNCEPGDILVRVDPRPAKKRTRRR